MRYFKFNTIMNVDTLITNGHFVTLDEFIPECEAIAIDEGKIVWIGTNKEAKGFKSPEVIDLKGAYVYPGFIDSHIHVLYSGIIQKTLRLEGCQNHESVVDRLKTQVAQTAPGEWILGFGWDDCSWPKENKLHASTLDAVSPHNPVVLQRSDTHLIWVNSRALKEASIDEKNPDPVGGKIVRDEKGNPTGVLIDTASYLVRAVMPSLDVDRAVLLTLEMLEACAKNGITMVHDASTIQPNFEAFKALASSGSLPIRVYAMTTIKPDMKIESIIEPLQQSPFFESRCLKFFMDGSLGSRGAALLEPYTDDSHEGLLLWNKEDLVSLLKIAKDKGFQVAAHAIGDRANRFILDAYEEVGVEDLRWRVEHAQLLSRQDIPRFKSLQIIAAMQPLHAMTDMAWIESRVGSKRAQEEAFVWKSLLDAGAIIAGGSDAPVVNLNPLWGIYAATTRQNVDGEPKEGWVPHEKVSRLEALKMYTTNAAYAGFHEHDLGSISKGKWADLVVYPENILTCDANKLLILPVLYTFVNGKVIYKA